MRVKIVNFGIIFIFTLLALCLLNMEALQSGKFRELSSRNCLRLIPQIGARGQILDRSGKVIVGNALSYDVMILPQTKDEIDKTLKNISQILGSDFEELKQRFKDSYAAWSLPITIEENIEVEKAIQLGEVKSDLPYVTVQPHPVRYYPNGSLACHVLGYLNEIDHWRLVKLADYGYKTRDIVGFGGIEEKYDYYLRQEEGGFLVEVDSRGRSMGMLGFKPPHNGKDIRLTLDLRIQKIAEENLNGKKGSVIIMNPYTGEIIALANSPNFNPKIFMERQPSSIKNLFEDSDSPLINRAISGTYPAGSIFKLVVGSAALEMGKINPFTTFVCPGSINIGKRKFSCWDKHHQENLDDAIIHSCNIFFYRTGLALGAKLIHDYALKFGFSRLTYIDLPYESAGFVPSPIWRRINQFKKWYDGDTANFSIGQGELQVTPLQLTRMMAVFANNGNLVTPYLVKYVDGKDISFSQKKIIRLPMKETTINVIRESLRKVVSDFTGTGHLLADLEIQVAGKTGTAQVSGKQSHGWFLGFFPFKTPKFVICVFLEHAGSGQVSCAVAKQIIKSMIEQGLI